MSQMLSNDKIDLQLVYKFQNGMNYRWQMNYQPFSGRNMLHILWLYWYWVRIVNYANTMSQPFHPIPELTKNEHT